MYKIIWSQKKKLLKINECPSQSPDLSPIEVKMNRKGKKYIQKVKKKIETT